MSNADRYTLETPENIEVEFELAGLGSRFCAMLIDGLLIWLLVFVLIVLAILLSIAILTAMRRSGREPAAGSLAAGGGLGDRGGADVRRILHLLRVGDARPDAGQEGHEDSRHPRRRHSGDGSTRSWCGTSSGSWTSCPSGYALGALVMFLNPLCKRLGDLAAGTIVVKEGQLDYRALPTRSTRWARPPWAWPMPN